MSAFQQSGGGIFGSSRPVTGGHSAKCVCSICECGRHKCPPGKHHPGHYDADSLRSTYGKDFPGHVGAARQPIRHPSDSHVRSNEPFDHKTTHSLDYSGHPGARPADPYKPPHGSADRGLDDRDFKSEGASQYGAKPGKHKRESFAPRGASIVSGLPFDGSSTSKTDFPGWHGVRPPAPYKLGDSVLRPAGENRDFKSEAAGHYTDKSHPGMGQRRAAPGSVRGPSVPFEGQSTHSSDFKATGGKPATAFVPKLMFTSQPEDRNFQSESHGKHDDKGVQPRIANRGMHQLAPSLPFEGKSTQATDFPSWSGARPSTSARPQARALANGPEDRDFRSETARNYDAKPLPLKVKARGGPGWQRTDEDREFSTEAKSNMGPKGYQKRESMKPSAASHVQGLPFDGQSTAKTDFREYPGAQPARARNIPRSTVGGPDDRDFTTDARANYGEKTAAPCPANSLAPRQPPGPGQHAYYVPNSTGRWTPISG